jgi:hypothetical protein
MRTKERLITYYSDNMSDAVYRAATPSVRKSFAEDGKQLTVQGRQVTLSHDSYLPALLGDKFHTRAAREKFYSGDRGLTPSLAKAYPSWDLGNPFWTSKQECFNRCGFIKRGYYDAFNDRNDIGSRFYAVNPNLTVNPYPPAEPRLNYDADLDAFGTYAIGEVAPTKPHAGLLTALGEIRNDGLPKIPGLLFLRDRKAQALGDEYLNYTFGVAPTVSDIKDIAGSIKKHASILKKFLSESDTDQHRRYTGPTVVSTVREDLGLKTPFPFFGGHGYQGISWPLTKTTTTRKSTWFSGCFNYHLDLGTGLVGHIEAVEQKANHLLGTRLTPEVLWNLTPWTWMLDWFGNIGGIMHNLSLFAEDGLQMQYGYVMQTTVTEYSYEMVPNFIFNRSDIRPIPLATTFRTTVKRRRPASPFGFGVHGTDLSPKQIAILGALGISRVP